MHTWKNKRFYSKLPKKQRGLVPVQEEFFHWKIYSPFTKEAKEAESMQNNTLQSHIIPMDMGKSPMWFFTLITRRNGHQTPLIVNTRQFNFF